MKRNVAVILTAAILTVTPALADPVTDFIAEHNRNRLVSGASEITVAPELIKGRYNYHIDNIDIVISANDNGIDSFSCVCFDDSAIGEFLAQCVTAFYDIGGSDAYANCHGPLLFDFLAAREGMESKSNPSVPGVLFQVERLKNGRYIFIIVKVK